MKSFVKGKIFRTALVLLCGAGLAMSAAVAQQDTAPPANGAMQGPQGGQRGMNPERQLTMMQQQLTLTDDQTAQIRQILTDASGKMEALRANTALAQDDRRAQMMTLRQGVQAKIRAALTPDQQTKFDAMQESMRQRRGAGGDGAAPQPAQQSPQR
jgi:Spy/CpxP family protein refolding chaperone